jgi:hypothetical protein
VPVSVPAVAAGASGISDVSIGQVGDNSAIDQKQDARIGQQPGTTAADEQKASVGSNGQAATPAPAVSSQSLPTNHPMTAQQYKELKKQQERQAKYLKKHPEALKAAQAAAAQAAAANPAPAETTPQK